MRRDTVADCSVDDLPEVGTQGHDVADDRMISSGSDLTPEGASRMAVTAVTSDVEYWARCVAVAGQVGLNDLTRVLEVIRQSSLPEC
ncbi:MAG: hypothetical protein QOH68_3589 [Nocardioidaceae bacterium]|jgi:hypothetical protein|nr:hypothetical protein [Nocardioidaceae bacterium]